MDDTPPYEHGMMVSDISAICYWLLLELWYNDMNFENDMNSGTMNYVIC